MRSKLCCLFIFLCVSCSLKNETSYKKNLIAGGCYTVKDGLLVNTSEYSKKIEFDFQKIKIGNNIHKVDSINILTPAESFYYFNDSIMEIIPSLDKGKYEIYFYKSNESTIFKQYYLCVEK